MKEPSLLDPNMIARIVHDDELKATRVTLVGAEMPELKLGDIKLPEMSVQTIEVPVIVKETEIVQIEKPVIVKEVEIREVSVPLITKEIEYVIKEVPVIQTNIEIVEKPIVIKETEVVQKDLPKMLVLAIAAQTLATIVLLLKMFLK